MINMRELSIELLNKIANSMIEREALKEIFFSNSEIELVSLWLNEHLEIKSPE